MPYKTDKIRLKPHQDRRRKLSDAEKELIKSLTGISQRRLAKSFGVSQRTIQFILDPQKRLDNLERRKERGGWRQYYQKEKQTKYKREHRRYKHKILTEEGKDGK